MAGPGLRRVLFSALAVALAITLAPLDRLRGVQYFEQSFHIPGQTENTAPMQTEHYSRDNVYFQSQNTRIEAWLYKPHTDADGDGPRGRGPTGCIIMAHGLGGQRDFGLHRFADRFARAGYAVLVFDYRTFGGSDGEPRHWVSPSRHVEDWDAAVMAVKEGLGGRVQCKNIGLWGTSFSGGHAVVTAAKFNTSSAAEPSIRAVVSQIPHLDGFKASKASLARRGLRGSLLMLLAGLHDRGRAALGLRPAYVRLVGARGEGELAVMQLGPDELQDYGAKHPAVKQGGWQPVVLARVALGVSRYSPILSVPHVAAPILFAACERDTLCPAEDVEAAAAVHAKVQPMSEFVSLPCTHFELYLGDFYETIVAKQLEFLQKHV